MQRLDGRADHSESTTRAGGCCRPLRREVVGFYEDAGIGAKGRDKRPGFDRLLKDATARKIEYGRRLVG